MLGDLWQLRGFFGLKVVISAFLSQIEDCTASELQNIKGFSDIKSRASHPLKAFLRLVRLLLFPHSLSDLTNVFPKIPHSVKALLRAQSFMQIILFIFMMYANEVFTLNILYDAMNVRIDLELALFIVRVALKPAEGFRGLNV